MSFRYIAGYTPAKGDPPKQAPIATLLLADASGQVVKTLWTSPPLGNYSYDVFSGFSPPINVSATSLGVTGDGPLYLTLSVENRDRNLQIPLDDLANGWDVTLGWAKAA